MSGVHPSMLTTGTIALLLFLPMTSTAQIGAHGGLLVDAFWLKGANYSGLAGNTRSNISDQWGAQVGTSYMWRSRNDTDAVLFSLGYREIRFHTSSSYRVGPNAGWGDYFVRTTHLVATVAVSAKVAEHWALLPGFQTGLPLFAETNGHVYRESFEHVTLDEPVSERSHGAPYSLVDNRLQLLAEGWSGGRRHTGAFVRFGPSFGFGTYIEGSWESARSLRFEFSAGYWIPCKRLAPGRVN